MSASEIDISLLLASSVHDIKNSLGMVLGELDQLIADSDPADAEGRRRLAVLRGESARINSDLVALLGLYRLNEQSLPLHLEEVFVADWLGEQCAGLESLFAVRGLSLHCSCDEDLCAFFDPQLTAGIVHNALVNAARYAATETVVSARQADDGGIWIQIEDDGPGFPASMCGEAGADPSINFQTGSTRLGLVFAAAIAGRHQAGARQGHLQLDNSERGGRFQVYLP